MASEKENPNHAGRKGLDYNPEFMRGAFALYCQGMTYTAIAARMGSEYPNLCRQTIARIANKFNWEESRARYIELQVDGEGERERLIGKLQDMIERLEHIIEGGSENHQHYAQWARLTELRARMAGILDGDDGTLVLATDREMECYMDAMESDPVAGPILKKRRVQIQKRFQENLEKNGIEKN